MMAFPFVPHRAPLPRLRCRGGHGGVLCTACCRCCCRHRPRCCCCCCCCYVPCCSAAATHKVPLIDGVRLRYVFVAEPRGCDIFFIQVFFNLTSTLQLLDKPWSQVSSLPPPCKCIHFYHTEFNIPIERRTFIDLCELALSRFPLVNL